MYACFKKLWNDDQGALIASEWLIMASIPVMGLAGGMVALRNSVNGELSQYGNSVSALRQSYSYQGLAGAGASVTGGAAATPGSLGSGMTMVPAPAPAVAGNLPAF
jgi:hypothetical protein